VSKIVSAYYISLRLRPTRTIKSMIGNSFLWFISKAILSNDMGQNPLHKMIKGENTPELEYSTDFGLVVTHEELEGVEGGNVECQKLTNLRDNYLINRTML
jgi:hypothetical protein